MARWAEVVTTKACRELRLLEAALRKSVGLVEAREALRECGMTPGEVWAFELVVRRTIREERSPARRAGLGRSA